MIKMIKDEFDRFYTKENIAINLLNELYKVIDINEFNTIIEPTAGNGAFSRNIDKCLAFDIFPQNDHIIKKDIFDIDFNKFERKIILIGNLPFGRQNKFIFKFLKFVYSYIDCFAFILPASFKKLRAEFFQFSLNKMLNHFTINFFD